MAGIARAGLVGALALAASGCEALVLAADGVVLGLHTAGDTVAYCDGGEPLAPEELPWWVRVEDPRMPTADQLQDAAIRIQVDPRKEGIAAGYYPFSSLHATKLKMYGVGPVPPPSQRNSGQYLLWDGVPGNRLLYFPYSSYYEASFLFGYGSTETRTFDGGTGSRLPIHCDGNIVSIPYSGTWSVRPAGRPLAEYLEKSVNREIDGVPERYRFENTHRFLFGVFGWGRVNRTRYLQILWIPIPVGRVGEPPGNR